MAERPLTKPEIASQKLAIKLAPAIGDWTTYRPQKVLVKKVKTGLYGFDRLSKKELDLALRIHYRFVQELLSHLKMDLKAGVEFFSCQVEQTTYLNFLRTLSGPVVQGKLLIPDIHEGVQVFFDLGLAHSIINHALGSRDIEFLNRGLTEAENSVLAATLTEYLPGYAGAFENVFTGPSFQIIGSPDATLDPSINTSSSFVSFSAEAALGDGPPGKITFGYLASSLKNLLKAFEEKDRIKPLNFGRLPAIILNRILISMTALLGKTNLFTSELHRLETGDVVSLDALTNSALTMIIGDLIKVKVQPGIRNKKKSVRVAGFREEEEIEIAPPIEIKEEIKPEPKPAPPPPPPPAAPPPAPELKPLEEELPEEDFLEEEEFPEEDLFEEEEEFPEEENKGEV